MIRIYRDAGGDLNPGDYEVVAEYDPDVENWKHDEVGLAEFYPPGTPAEAILRHLDGPSYIAVDGTEGSDVEKSGGPVPLDSFDGGGR